MFPRRFFARRFFAPRYFPQSAGGVVVVLVGRIIRLVGSYIATIPMIGGYVTSITVTGSVSEDGN